MGKGRKNGDTVHKLGLGGAGREATRKVEVGLGEQVKVELPAPSGAHVKELIGIEGLRLLSRHTEQGRAKAGEGTETILVTLADGQTQGLLTVSHVDRNNPERVMRRVEVQVLQIR